MAELRLISNRVRERLATLDLSNPKASMLDQEHAGILRDIFDGRMPNAHDLWRLAEALNTTVAYLQGDCDEPAALGLGLAEQDRLPQPAGKLDATTLNFAPLKDGQVRLVLDEVVDQETFLQIMKLLKKSNAAQS